MSFTALALPAVAIVGLSSLILLINPDWRLSILVLCLQYVGVFLLVAQDWPLSMAVSKLVAGWIAGAVVGMALASLPAVAARETQATSPNPEAPSSPADSRPAVPTGRLFRLLAATLVGLIVISASSSMNTIIPGIHPEQAWGGLILLGMGILQLGFTAQPFRTILGLLTCLAGFEVLYAVVEYSALVAGLLTAINLGLALVGAYLLVAPSMEENE